MSVTIVRRPLRQGGVLLALLCFMYPPVVLAAHHEDSGHTQAVCAPADEARYAESIAAARKVMDDFLTAFNARDESGWADTLLFPHVRVASGGVSVIPDKATFLRETDMNQFAADNNWAFSRWDCIETMHAGEDKVHFKVLFSRYNPAGERYVSFNSLYVIQRVEGRWGVRARSSFAP